jgi:hypothetical protein
MRVHTVFALFEKILEVAPVDAEAIYGFFGDFIFFFSHTAFTALRCYKNHAVQYFTTHV